MTQPTVCAVMLTADRQDMTDRAVRCFLAQDYPDRSLLILDSGAVGYTLPKGTDNSVVRWMWVPQLRGRTIGALRNFANAAANPSMVTGDILVHFDSDDWSAHTRISDQVKLLVESGKQAVGYREMLFWQERIPIRGEQSGGVDIATLWQPGQAWLYRNTNPKYALATSLCYHRATWEAKPFPDCMIGSEREWLKGLDVLGVTANPLWFWEHETARKHPAWRPATGFHDVHQELPSMLATIHGSNTVKNQISLEAANPDGSKMWQRVPAWDARVRSILEST